MQSTRKQEHENHSSFVARQVCTRRRLLYVGDVVWSCAVICPVIIVYWSATWRLLDLLFASSSPTFDATLCMSWGFFILFTGYYILPMLHKVVGRLNGLRHVLVSRVFLYYYAFGTIMYWRGVWNMAYIYSKQNVVRLSSLYLMASSLLLVLRACTHAIGSPFAIELDSEAHFYHTFPRYRTKPDANLQYAADACFTTAVIQTAGIIVWFSLWSLSDIFIYPHNTFHSYVVSLLAGYFIAALLFIVQGPVYHFAYIQSSFIALVVEDAYKMFATVAALSVWRGMWGFARDFVFTDNTAFTLAWSCHLAGFLVMVLMRVGRTLASVGCAIDAELGHATGTIWPVAYFRSHGTMHKSLSSHPHLRVQVEPELDFPNVESSHLI